MSSQSGMAGRVLFSDALDCYQAIAQVLAAAAAAQWSRIEVDATLDGNRVDATVAYWQAEEDAPSGYLSGVPIESAPGI